VSVPLQLNPVLTGMRPYPFLALDEARRRAIASGRRLIDFSVGEPHEATDATIREALADSLEEVSSYPKAEGLPELKQAVAAWCRRRYGVPLDPQTEVVPTLGSKEAIFSLPFVAMEPGGRRDTMVVTEPGYPIPERAAMLAGAQVLRLPLRESNRFLPDLEEVPAATWDRVAILLVNYPNNPTAAMASLDFYRDLARRAERHGFLVASDEAYSEVYFGEPPVSALQVEDRSRMAVFNTQSKRSSMPGYRTGFLAAPPELIRGYKLWRPLAGVAIPEFIQRATVRALATEDHVERMRAVYAAKRELFLEFFHGRGIRVAGSEATFYLWCEVPGGEDSEVFAARLLERGVVVAPGSFFGDAGEGYFRVALVPTLDECRRAVEILEGVL
jgi:succinyldiaminopimelate transaminase